MFTTLKAKASPLPSPPVRWLYRYPGELEPPRDIRGWREESARSRIMAPSGTTISHAKMDGTESNQPTKLGVYADKQSRWTKGRFKLNGGALSSRRSADNRISAYVAFEAGSPGHGAATRAAACILPSCGRLPVRPGAPEAPRDERDPRKRVRRAGRGHGRRRRGRPRPVHKSERRTGARAGLRRGPQEARAPSG